MKYEKLRIILTSRNTKEYLVKAVESIRKNEHYKNDIVIYDDNSTDESRQWIVDNSEKYNFTYFMINEVCKEGYDRMGITGAYNLSVDESPYDVPIMLGHSDMYYCKDFDINLLKHTGKKKVVCSTRIEPPLHPEEPKVKYTKDFGMFPKDLVEDELDIYSIDLVQKNKDKYTNGVFAPMVFFKSDWNEVGGIHEEFYPQSREDSVMWSEWTKLGFDFIQVWDSLVYHFTCRGSRFKDGFVPSSEWQDSNKKNLANYQRIWKEYPRYTETHLPTIPHKVNKISLVTLTKNNEATIQRWLETYEPFVDEIILVDDYSNDHTLEKALEYFDNLKDNSLVSKDKLKIVSNDLNKDFGAARNLGAEEAENDWVLQIDQDEWFDTELNNMLNWIIIAADKKEQNCVAFPRKNLIDGVLVNDIPREQQVDYVKSVLDKKSDVKGETNIKHDPDLQCRLHKKDVKWIRPVHEMLEPFFNALVKQDADSAKKVMIFGEGFINHFKSTKEQQFADKFYETISKGASLKQPVKTPNIRQLQSENGKSNLVYNSVLFTNEGISKHAREELKVLSKDWNVSITSAVPDNADQIYKDMEIDFPEGSESIYFINQPPIRQNDPSKSLLGNKDKKNIVYFLAMEGSKLPREWTDAINESKPKLVITPSTFCKEMFEDSGVKVPIKVIPHGVDSETIKSAGKLEVLPKELDDQTSFLWAGTYRGSDKHDRKGLNVMIKAWEKFLKTPESKDCVLILKISSAYYPGTVDEWKNMIGTMIDPFKGRVMIIDDILSDIDMFKLLKSVDCYINPALSEGFGMCLHPETKIFCQNGIKKIIDIGIKDKVLTHKGNFKKVISKSERKINEEIVKITANCSNKELILTKEHPIYCIKRKFKKMDSEKIDETKLEWITAKNIKKGDLVVLPKYKSEQTKEVYDMCDYDEKLINSPLEVSYKMGYSPKNKKYSYTSLVSKFGYTKSIWETVKKHIKQNTKPHLLSKAKSAYKILINTGFEVQMSNKYPRFIQLDEDLAFIFGWYTAEGSGGNGFIEFSLHIDEVNEANKIEKIMKQKFGTDVLQIENIEHKSRRVICSGTHVSKFFHNECGHTALNKKVPVDIFFNKNLSILKTYLESLYCGDGCIFGNSNTLCTISDTLRFQVMLILIKLNKNPSCSVRNFKTRPGFPSINDSYHIAYPLNKQNKKGYKSWIKHNYDFMLVKSVTQEQYVGKVYNIEVKDDNSYTTDCCVVHNCALESLACGTPVIATDTSGMKDFLTKDNSLKIKVLRKVDAENVYPYRNAEGITQFDLPSTNDLVAQMKKFTENKDKYKDIAVKESVKILDEYSWEKVVGKMNKEFKLILKK